MECGICYIEENILKTDCGHFFCSKCLSTWREIKNNCPVCRSFISYTIKVRKEGNTFEPRVTRSMTKAKRELEFYNNFKQHVIDITDTINDTNDRQIVTQYINNIVKLCLKNYKLMPPNIYKLILEIVESKDYHINNRNIIKKRLIEIKPNINYDSTIDI